MGRTAEFLELIDDPQRPALATEHPADGPLLELLVHLAMGDGVLQSDEVALLRRVSPGRTDDELRAWTQAVSARPFDLEALVSTCGDEGLDVLRLAARMACLDGDLADAEIGRLTEMAQRFGLPAHAPRDVLDEVVARGGPVAGQHVRDALRSMWWNVLIPSRDELSSDLATVVARGASHVCSVGLGEVEVAGLFLEGLAARFDTGPAYVAWVDIVAYTRVPVPGAAFHLRTREGRSLSMSDPRLRDIGALLDFIHGRTPVPR